MRKTIFIIISFCFLLTTCTKNTQNSDDENKEFVIECGMYVSEDVTLSEDMTCPFDGPAPITITGSNLTLDLGGHMLRNDNYYGNIGIIVHDGVSDVTIRNGIIEDFEVGIDIREVSNITLENITFRNLKIENADYVAGAIVTQSDSVVVRNCSFDFTPNFHHDGIAAYSSSVYLDSLFFPGGGSVLVTSFGGDNCNGAYSTGSLTNSWILNTKAGALFQCTDDFVVKNNEFVNCDVGIVAYGPESNSNKNLVIENNYTHGNTATGIEFWGTIESTIRANEIVDGWYGIKLSEDHESFNSSTDFYSTDNLVIDNVVTDNDTDLYHHPQSIGNTWINNTCGTKKGAEIPECTG